jgi:hypothetical protein
LGCERSNHVSHARAPCEHCEHQPNGTHALPAALKDRVLYSFTALPGQIPHIVSTRL